MALSIQWGKTPQTTSIPQDSIDWGTAESRASIAQNAQSTYAQPASSSLKEAVGNALSGAKEAVSQLPVENKSFSGLYKSPLLTFVPAEKAIESWVSTIEDTAQRFRTALDTYRSPTSTGGQKAGATLSAGLGVVNDIFSPITAGLAGLSPIPGVGNIADGLNAMFAAISGGSGAVAVDALRATPLSDQTKKDLEPSVRELGALVGNIAAGAALHTTTKAVEPRVNLILEKVKNDPVVKTQAANPSPRSPLPGAPATKLAVQSLSGESPVAISTKQGFPMSTRTEELPVIEMGPGIRSKLPTIQIGESPLGESESLTYEPIKAPVAKPSKTTSLAAKPAIPAEAISWSKSETPTVASPESGYTHYQSQTALKLVAEAQARGISFSPDIPLQERVNMLEQAKLADQFVSSARSMADQVVFDRKTPPPGLNVESVYRALERKSLRDADIPLMEKLSRTSIGKEAGVGLKSLDTPDFDANPVEALRSIREARTNAVARRMKVESVTKEVAKEKAKVEKIKPPSKDTWQAFIKSLEC